MQTYTASAVCQALQLYVLNIVTEIVRIELFINNTLHCRHAYAASSKDFFVQAHVAIPTPFWQDGLFVGDVRNVTDDESPAAFIHPLCKC